MKVRHVDHIGLVVEDLDAATAFFVDLGFSVQGEATLGGEWVDRIIGLEGTKSDVVMLQAADGQVSIELSKFQSPEYSGDNDSRAPSNKPGLRHLAFEVDDLQGIVDILTKKGYEFFSDIQVYEDIYKLCYVRGPEGIIVELAESMKAA